MRIHIFFLVISGFFLSYLSHAQNTADSLRAILNENKSAEEHGLIYTHLGKFYYKQKELDSAKNYFLKALYLNKEHNIAHAASNANYIGIIYTYQQQLDSSIIFYKEAFALTDSIHDQKKAALTAYNIALNYKNLGSYENAIKYALMAEGRLNEDSISMTMAHLYTVTGNLYRQLNTFDKAKAYHARAAFIYKQLNDIEGQARSMNNLGNIYNSLKEYDSALLYFTRALDIHRQYEDSSSMAVALNNIGELYLKTGSLDQSIQFLTQALSINRNINNDLGLLINLNNLADIHLTLQDLEKAENYLLEGRKLAEEIGALKQKVTNLGHYVRLHFYHQNENEFQNSLTQYGLLKDSLFNLERAESIANLEVKYSTEKKEQEINLLQKDAALKQAKLELRDTWIFVLIISSLFAMSVAFLLFRNFRITRKGKKKVELLLKELQHRIKNNLQVISSLLKLQTQYVGDSNAIDAIKAGENRVNALALIHKRLYVNDQISRMDTRSYIAEIVENLLFSYGFYPDDLNVELDIEETTTDVDIIIPIGLIINELVSNSIKYCLKLDTSKTLNIDFHSSNDHYHLTIGDNGSGISIEDHQTTQSLGLKIVKNLVSDLHGNITYDKTHSGTRWKVIIPYHNNAPHT